MYGCSHANYHGIKDVFHHLLSHGNIYVPNQCLDHVKTAVKMFSRTVISKLKSLLMM